MLHQRDARLAAGADFQRSLRETSAQAERYRSASPAAAPVVQASPPALDRRAFQSGAQEVDLRFASGRGPWQLTFSLALEPLTPLPHANADSHGESRSA